MNFFKWLTFEACLAFAVLGREVISRGISAILMQPYSFQTITQNLILAVSGATLIVRLVKEIVELRKTLREKRNNSINETKTKK